MSQSARISISTRAATIPFFDCFDLKSRDYSGYNPYLYCAANPVMFSNPTCRVTTVVGSGKLPEMQ